MKRFLTILILTFITFTGCEKNVSLSPKADHFIAVKHLSKIDGSEMLSQNVQQLILSEQSRAPENDEMTNIAEIFWPKNHPKFPLSYYLVPESDISFSFSQPINDKIDGQLILRISGRKHNKLFIHPGQEHLFKFLKNKYSYVGPSSTEFFATPTSKTSSLIVWNKNNSDRSPFLVDVVQPQKANEQKREISSSEPATEVAEYGNSKELLGVQIVKEIPLSNAK